MDRLLVGFVLLAGGRAVGGADGGAPGKRGERVAFGPLLSALVWGGSAVAVFVAFILIPAVRYPDSVYYAFVTQISRLPILGSGLPAWLNQLFLATVRPADYATFYFDFLNYANWVLIGTVVLVCALVVWRCRRVGQPIGLADSRLLGLVALAAVLQIVLGKW